MVQQLHLTPQILQTIVHPFKLSSTNADSSGGTEYTDGVAYFVNGSQKNGSDYVSQYSNNGGGFRGIKWTVPHDVSTTYYYCTSQWYG